MSSSIGLRCSTAKPDSRPRPDTGKSRDKVKDLLLNKLLKKFAQYPSAKTIIPPKVTKMLNQSRLTDANLKKLEQEILDAIKADEIEQKKKLQEKTKKTSGVPSQVGKQEQKQIEKVENKSKVSKNEQEIDDFLLDGKPSRRIQYNDDQDWDAILKFNAELHQEELRQEEEKRLKQKNYVKTELEKQKQEKVKIQEKAKEETEQYDQLEKQHLQFLDKLEKEKEEGLKKRKMDEKARLDKQLKDNKMRKYMEDLENKKYEESLVDRCRRELEDEKMTMQKRKDMQREYHKKTMEENEINKKLQMEQLAQQKEQEKKDLIAYAKILEQQEEARNNEVKNREKRTQDLMSRMADTVIKKQDEKRAAEDQKVIQYQMEKELRDKMDDDERLRRIKESKQEMRKYLTGQMDEKKKKFIEEKQDNLKQAEVWKKEQQMYTTEERAIREKMLATNKEYAEYLKKQMNKNKRGAESIMNREEYLMNKKLIEEIEQKRAQSRQTNS